MADPQSDYSEVASRVFAGDTAAADNPLFGLGQDLMSEFLRAETERREVEERWLQDLRQYKGRYDPEVEKEIVGSKAFLRKTRIKVESVDARMTDLLFPANRERNYQVEATPEPSIPAPQKKKLVEMLTQLNQGQKPDAQTIKSAVKDFADQAARRMDDRIHDQLTEAKYRKVARSVLHSGHLYGTGILKGPLVEHRTRLTYQWDDEKGRFVQTAQRFSAPFLSDVPIWHWYPDMSVTELEHCGFVWERHRLSRKDIAVSGRAKDLRKRQDPQLHQQQPGRVHSALLVRARAARDRRPAHADDVHALRAVRPVRALGLPLGRQAARLRRGGA